MSNDPRSSVPISVLFYILYPGFSKNFLRMSNWKSLAFIAEHLVKTETSPIINNYKEEKSILKLLIVSWKGVELCSSYTERRSAPEAQFNWEYEFSSKK